MLRRVLQTGLISILLVACNSSTPLPPTFTATIVPTATATNTPTSTPLPTATPVTLNLKVIKELVNCRSGPGVVFELMNELSEGQTARVIGRDSSSTWWYIRDPGNPGGFCWVSAEVSEIDGDSSTLPIAQSFVTNVIDLNLVVEPNRMVVGCFEFPQTFFFSAEVTSDGPLIAQWQWESNVDGLIETGTLAFEQAGTKIINQYYQVDAANDYWMKLSILSPTQFTKQVDFRVTCS